MFSQKTGQNMIPWSGTNDGVWRNSGHVVRFHFSDPDYRRGFLAEADRLLRGLWRAVSQSDEIAAVPASHRRRL